MRGGAHLLAAALAAAALLPATAGAADHAMTVNEVMTSSNGGADAQFVELLDPLQEPFPAPAYHLAVYGPGGGAPLASQEVSKPIPSGGDYLLVATAAADPGASRDRDLTIDLPLAAGQLCFERALGQRIHCLRWGCVTNAVGAGAGGAAPPDGQSAQRDGSSTVIAEPTPKAQNRDGSASVACPTSGGGTQDPPAGGGTGGGGTTGGGTGGGGTAPPAVPGDTPPDTAAPAALVRAARRGLRSFLFRGLDVRVQSDEPAAIEARLSIARRVARRLGVPRGIARATGTLTAAGTRRLVLRPSRRLRRRLAAARSLRARLVTTVTDAAGNPTTDVRAIGFGR